MSDRNKIKKQESYLFTGQIQRGKFAGVFRLYLLQTSLEIVNLGV